MKEPKRISIPLKIAVAAVVILLVTAAIMLIFGDRKWQGLETLLTASMLTPLSALFWPLIEAGGYIMLFGIDAARQAIWRRWQNSLAQAREEGIEEGIKEGYRRGYDARAAEENRQNGQNRNAGGSYDDFG